MSSHVHRLAAAANATALVLVTLFGAVFNSTTQYSRPGKIPDLAKARMPANQRVLLVVVDGLRDDTSRDPTLMPWLSATAASGLRTVAVSEALIPSTVAGITTLATGVVPGPPSFLHDFRAPPATDGGLFEAVARRGGQSFVAGPALWSNMFAEWTRVAYAADDALAASDENVIASGINAWQAGTHDFGVIHLCRLDEAGHLHGTRSPAFAGAARRCDEDIRRIASAVGPDAVIVVTSDHGTTDVGGHAGPEPEVLKTPLLIIGQAVPAGVKPPPVRQRDVPVIVAGLLGTTLPTSPTANGSHENGVAPWMISAFAIVGAIIIWARLAEGDGNGRPYAFWLNATLWAAVALFAAQRPTAGAVTAAAVLVGVALLIIRSLTSFRSSFLHAMLTPTAVLGAGVAWGTIRFLSDAWTAALITQWLPVPAFVRLALGLIAALAAGWAIGRWVGQTGANATRASITLFISVTFAEVVAGQTLSLSSLDVHWGYHAALHSGGAGLTVAIAVTFARQALFPLGVAAVAFRNARELPDSTAAPLVVGLSATPAGEAIVATCIFLAGDEVDTRSIAVGALLRTSTSFVFLSCGAVAIMLVAPRRRGARPSKDVVLDG